MKKLISFLLLIFLLAASLSAVFAADVYYGDIPYIPYIYNEMGTPVAAPAAYIPDKTLTGHDLGVGPLKDPTDVFFHPDGKVYIVDSGNSRVIILDKTFQLIKVVDRFENSGNQESFKNPEGVYVTRNGIFIADTGNGRIVHLDDELKLIAIYGKPLIDMLDANYNYSPQKIAVDYAGRMYVIARGINQGLLQMDSEGMFMSFLGAPRVSVNIADLLWKRISTDAQKERMVKFVPTEYNSLFIDKKGFIYTTSNSNSVKPVSRLNSLGQNVLRATGNNYPKGDLYNPTAFVDIAVSNNGIYSVLDSMMGRVFSYDEDGQLLYVFGSMGGQKGTFRSPSAIEFVDDRILVLDKFTGKLNVFAKSIFGITLENAIILHRKGKYDEAEMTWKEVLRQCSNYDIAYVGLARIDIQKGRYGDALKKLSAIGDRHYYSKAFKEYRSLVIRKNFTVIFIGTALGILILIFLGRFLRATGIAGFMGRFDTWCETKYGMYVMFHPFDGFWDLKREKRGSAVSALVIFGLFIFMYSMRVQYSGYLFLNGRSENINIIYEILKIVVPLFLWCIANWCFTTLMDGEGNLKDIFISTPYSLVPYIVLSVPLFLMSHVLTRDESMFYYLLDTVAVAWSVGLLMLGVMMTHHYSLKKMLLTTLLSLVGIGLMIFIALLFFNLIQEVFTFGFNVYKEIMFRTY